MKTSKKINKLPKKITVISSEKKTNKQTITTPKNFTRQGNPTHSPCRPLGGGAKILPIV